LRFPLHGGKFFWSPAYRFVCHFCPFPSGRPPVDFFLCTPTLAHFKKFSAHGFFTDWPENILGSAAEVRGMKKSKSYGGLENEKPK
jgi:hypothetical protein